MYEFVYNHKIYFLLDTKYRYGRFLIIVYAKYKYINIYKNLLCGSVSKALDIQAVGHGL